MTLKIIARIFKTNLSIKKSINNKLIKMNPLKGKIYWVEEDFKFEGIREPKKEETSYVVARIENVLIDEFSISFTVLPHGEDEISYKVNLLRNDIGLGFTGTFNEITEVDWEGTANCEVFSNEKKYMLYGNWQEDECHYTWWALIDN